MRYSTRPSEARTSTSRSSTCLRFRMIVIILAQDQAPARVEVQKPLHRLDVLDGVVIQLTSHLKK